MYRTPIIWCGRDPDTATHTHIHCFFVLLFVSLLLNSISFNVPISISGRHRSFRPECSLDFHFLLVSIISCDKAILPPPHHYSYMAWHETNCPWWLCVRWWWRRWFVEKSLTTSFVAQPKWNPRCSVFHFVEHVCVYVLHIVYPIYIFLVPCYIAQRLRRQANRQRFVRHMHSHLH